MQISKVEQGQIILVNESCQAGCLHCPYGKKTNIFPKSVKSIIQTIESCKSNFFILSGGEPLEYPFFALLLQELQFIKKPFRIATGGHVYILPYIGQLKTLTHFSGFSLGTDMLVYKRNLKPLLRIEWLRNLNILENEKIHYSLTVTLGTDVFLEGLIKELVSLGCNPDFFMLSEKENEFISNIAWDNCKEVVTKYSQHKLILTGFRNNKALI